jgi:hypothetical protein
MMMFFSPEFVGSEGVDDKTAFATDHAGRFTSPTIM